MRAGTRPPLKHSVGGLFSRTGTCISILEAQEGIKSHLVMRTRPSTPPGSDPSKLATTQAQKRIDRRRFLSTAAAAATGFAFAGCNSPTTSELSKNAPLPAATSASDAPETTALKIGIIALTDCSPFVIAAEKGFFATYGLNVTIAKQAS